MALDIKRLLNKKSWTGEEVGRALVASLAHDIKHQENQDDQNYKPLFSQSEFETMEKSLKTEHDLSIYEVYKSIYNGLIDAFNESPGKQQQFYHGYYRYAHYLQRAQIAEDTLQRAELIPFVITEAQYNELKTETETRLKEVKENFSSLLFNMISEFIESPETAPEDIRGAIESTKREAVTNRCILDNYNKVHGRGYYQLEDGTRSDQMDEYSWIEKLEKEYLKRHGLSTNGEQDDFKTAYLYHKAETRLQRYKIFFKGIEGLKNYYKKNEGKELREEDGSEIMQALENSLTHKEDYQKTNSSGKADPSLLETELKAFMKWHYYTDVPSMTKYEIIKNDLCFYNGEESEDGNPKIKEFEADYPNLYKVLEAYIKDNFQMTRDNKDVIMRGELAKLGINKYITLTSADEFEMMETLIRKNETGKYDFLNRRRILLNGIVTIKAKKEYCLNENGEYIDNIDKILFAVTMHGIDSINENELQKEVIAAIEENLFKPSLSYYYAFNALVQILGDIYGVEEIKKAKLDMTEAEEKIHAMNILLYMFYAMVYGTKEEKEKKRKLIKKIFKPVDCEAFKPKQKTINEVTKEIKEMGFSVQARKELKTFSNFIEKLYRGL